MNQDMTAKCGDGIINVRVGAIIMRDGKFLMAGNEGCDYLYSVGGRIQFGETAEEAIVREVFEETGVRMEIERLGFIHENYFTGDSPAKAGKSVYEISFFFYMKTPENFSPRGESRTEDGRKEFFKWVTPDEEKTIYPAFFRTELTCPQREVKHFVTDGRIKKRI